MPCLGEDAAWSSNGWTADDVADGTVTDALLGSWPLQRQNFFDWKGGLGELAHGIGDQLANVCSCATELLPAWDACEAAYVEEYRSSVITQQYNKWALERPPPPNPPPPQTPPMGGWGPESPPPPPMEYGPFFEVPNNNECLDRSSDGSISGAGYSNTWKARNGICEDCGPGTDMTWEQCNGDQYGPVVCGTDLDDCGYRSFEDCMFEFNHRSPWNSPDDTCNDQGKGSEPSYGPSYAWSDQKCGKDVGDCPLRMSAEDCIANDDGCMAYDNEGRPANGNGVCEDGGIGATAHLCHCGRDVTDCGYRSPKTATCGA